MPSCFVFADIRGDYRLLVTLLTQLMNVAELKHGKWSWTVSDTVVVCLGNYVNRFEPQGTNRLTMTTQEAIIDSERIVSAFLQLQRPNDMGNSMIVLTGNHELSCVVDMPGYEYCQMANPQEETDRKLYMKFVQATLMPFLRKNTGIMAGWGQGVDAVYLSHASLVRKWFDTNHIQSIEDLNRKWRAWMDSNQTNQLRRLAQPDSPIMSSEMLVHPNTWREFDRDWLVERLGQAPYPKFVVATLIPVQRAQFCSFDVNLTHPRFNGLDVAGDQTTTQFKQVRQISTMLVSRTYDATDEIYFINNAMADTFCVLDQVDRQPQALKFELVTNKDGEGLYLKTSPVVMQIDEYRVYLTEVPTVSCKKSEYTRTLKPFTMEEMVALKVPGFSHIEKVSLVLFSHDMSKMLFLVDSDNKLVLPVGLKKTDENDWEALQRMVVERLGENVKFFRGGAVSDFEGSTRVWFKQTAQTPKNGKWIPVQDIFSSDSSIPHRVRTMLCVFVQSGLIPKANDFVYACPKWIVHNKNDMISKSSPWWAI